MIYNPSGLMIMRVLRGIAQGTFMIMDAGRPGSTLAGAGTVRA
jgi:hypothetical protein